MKHLTLFAFLLCLSTIHAQDENCARRGSFGEVELCFPKIAGYQECYLNPTIQPLADGTEVPANMVLAYYINDDTYQKIDSLDGSNFDDYFKIYGTKAIQQVPANRQLLEQMREMAAQSFTDKTWDLLDKEIEQLDFVEEAEIGVPRLIKSYTLNDDSFTNLLFMRIKS